MTIVRDIKLLQVIPFALRELPNAQRSQEVREITLSTIIELSDDIAGLEETLPKIKDGFKWLVVRELIKRGSKNLLTPLKKILRSKDQEQRIIAAKHLVEMQDLGGLSHYVKWVEKNRRFNNSILQSLQKTDSIPFLIESLPLLIKLLKISYQADFTQDTFDSLNGAVQETLGVIALRSDQCYKLVKELVENFINKNNSTIKSVKYLHYYLNRLEHSYYYNKSEKMSVAEVLSKINHLIKV